LQVEAAPFDIVIERGTVVTDGSSRDAAVAIRGGRIEALVDPGEATQLAAARRIDASGRLVMPGGVDPHCHVGIAVGAYTTLDDYASASLAALAGGTTTIVDFAIPATQGGDPLAALDERLALAAQSRCDYAQHGCITSAGIDVAATVRALAERGLRTIKLFTTYRGILMVETDTIEAVMTALRDVGGLAYVHAEANDLVEAAQREADAAGRIDAGGHAGTRPEDAEERAVADVLAAAERTGAPVYFVHQSTPGAIELVTRARRRGVAAFTESCPHYLTLDDGRYRGEHPERYVCCPPLRSRATVDALADRAVQGLVHAVGSDNCCYDTRQKTERADDVREMPNGLPGVETRLPIVFNRFVASGRMAPERFVAMVSTNPARLNGLYPRKGTISAGADADIAILDPRETRTVVIDNLHMPTDYTPYEGQSVTGWPTTVISGGVVVVDEGRLLDPGPVGRFVPASPIEADAVPSEE
jgi:dihydropyrimidinase